MNDLELEMFQHMRTRPYTQYEIGAISNYTQPTVRKIIHKSGVKKAQYRRNGMLIHGYDGADVFCMLKDHGVMVVRDGDGDLCWSRSANKITGVK